VAGTCECGDEPSIKWGNFLTSCKPVSFSIRTLLHGVSKYVLFLMLLETQCKVAVVKFNTWYWMVCFRLSSECELFV